MVHFLLNDERVTKNAPNSKGLTAMDIFKQSHRDDINDNQMKLILEQFKVLPSKDIRKKRNKHLDWLEKQRSSLMVVASLIVALAFQYGILSPPGGIWQENGDGHKVGEAVMATDPRTQVFYDTFIVFNTVALSSIYEQPSLAHKRVAL